VISEPRAPTDAECGGRVSADHPDRVRWNAKYAGRQPRFEPHPLVAEVQATGMPAGPAVELACGMSGNALALAAAGREVIAIDVSDLALERLTEEAARRGLASLITCVYADLTSWRPPEAAYALVLCVYFWSPEVFSRTCRSLLPGGLLAWEAPVASGTAPAHVREEWRLGPEQPATLLPDDFDVVHQRDVDGHHGLSRRMVARRHPHGMGGASATATAPPPDVAP
jgi:hypothetical protein